MVTGVMRTTTGAPGARLLGVGDHRPARVVPNSEIAVRIDSSDQWIRDRTGIVSRRLAAEDEDIVAMSVGSASKALAASGVAPEAVDLVLLASCTLLRPVPGPAATVATRIGAHGAGAVDVNAACAGFCYSLAMASDAIRAGSARHVVVIGTERFSNWMDWTDRGTSIIFADGSGAVVVGPSDEPGIGPVAWGSDGERAGLITIPVDDTAVRMDGPAVFRWATTQLAPMARRACELAGVEPADLAALIPHQANLRIVDALAKALGMGDAVVARDVIESGNTSAASVPLALATLKARGEVSTGDAALLFGFGAGLTYAGQVVLCP